MASDTTTNSTAASRAASLGPIQRFNLRVGIVNPEANGLYVRYVDHVEHVEAARAAAPAAQEAEPAVSEAWQERQRIVGGREWSDWYTIKAGIAKGERTEVIGCTEYQWRALYAHPPRPQADAGAPTTEAAYAIGAKGGTASDDERLAFEAWMSGHCWALCATWDGKGYRSDAEQGGEVDYHAMATRRLWAAWRDRSALAAAPQAPAAATESVLIDGVAYSVPAAVAAELLRLHLEAMEAPAAGAAPSQHITQPYTVADIRERVASGDYSAELMLQHAMLHLGAGAAPTDAKAALLSPSEQKWLLADPTAIRSLMTAIDINYSAHRSMVEPGEVEPWPPKRWTELRELGRAIIAVDPECFDEQTLRDFGFPVPTRAAARAQEADDGWMPIETAPRDGRVLLLGYYNAHGKWRTLRGEWVSKDQIAEYWEVEADPGWYETSVEAEDPPNAWPTNPTHWRLPPAPPAARARQEGQA